MEYLWLWVLQEDERMQIQMRNCGHFWEQNHNSLRITAWIKNTSVHRTSISKLLKEQFHNPEWEGMIIGPLTETTTTWAGMVPSRNCDLSCYCQ